MLAYSMSDNGDSFVYLAEAGSDPHPAISREMFQHGFTLTSQRWDDLYTGGHRPGASDPRREIFVKTSQMKAPQRVGGVLTVPDNVGDTQGLSISPNGRYAVVTAFRLSPPVIWGEYHPSFDTINLTVSCTETDAYLCPMQHLLVDLEKTTIEPLLQAPVMQASEGRELFTWTQENSLLLLNTFLPLDSVEGKARDERRSSVYAAEITIPARKIMEISQKKIPMHAFEIHPGMLRDHFVTDPFVAAYGPPMEFQRDSNGWKTAEAASVAPGPAPGLSIKLQESIDSAPKLVAHDTTTNRTAVLLDPNPQFSGLTFGPVEPFQWDHARRLPVGGIAVFSTGLCVRHEVSAHNPDSRL